MKQRRSLESHLNYLDTLLLVYGDPLWFLLEPLELLLAFEGRAEEEGAAAFGSLTLVREVELSFVFLVVVELVVVFLVVVLVLVDFLVVTAFDGVFSVSVVLYDLVLVDFLLVDSSLSFFTSTGRTSLTAVFLVSVE